MPSIGYQFKSSGSRQVIKDYDDIGAAARRSRQEVERQPRVASARAAGESPRVKSAAAESRAVEMIARKEAKTLERIERDKQNTIARNAKTREQIRFNTTMASLRDAEKAAKRAEERSAQRRAQVGASLLGVGGVVAGASIALGGAAYSKRAAALQQAQQLSTSGREAGAVGVGGSALLADATRTALSVRGTKTEDVLTAQQKYVQMTGDLEGAQRHAKTFAITARATGSSEENIAATAATLKDKFKIESDDEMKSVLSNLNFQGKKGAFEMQDASRYFAELGAAGQMFGAGIGSGGKGVATLGGLAQIARGAKGSGAEASTATQAMLRQLVAKSDVIQKKTGTKVFADKGKTITNDIKDTLVGVIGGAQGNQAIMQEIFGDEGKGAVAGLVSAYNDAARAVGADATEKERRAAGEAAMRTMLDGAIDAGGAWSETVQDAAANTDNASSKLTTAWESASSEVGDKMIAPMGKLAEVVASIDVKPFAEGLGLATEALAGLVAYLVKFFGLQASNTEKDSNRRATGDERFSTTTPVADLAANEAETAALKAKRGTTKEEKARLRELAERKDTLLSEIDNSANPWVTGSTKNTGGPGKGGLGLSSWEAIDVVNVDPGKRKEAQRLGGMGPPKAMTLDDDPWANLTTFESPEKKEARLQRTERANDGDRFTRGDRGNETAIDSSKMDSAAERMAAAAERIASSSALLGSPNP